MRRGGDRAPRGPVPCGIQAEHRLAREVSRGPGGRPDLFARGQVGRDEAAVGRPAGGPGEARGGHREHAPGPVEPVGRGEGGVREAAARRLQRDHGRQVGRGEGGGLQEHQQGPAGDGQRQACGGQGEEDARGAGGGSQAAAGNPQGQCKGQGTKGRLRGEGQIGVRARRGRRVLRRAPGQPRAVPAQRRRRSPGVRRARAQGGHQSEPRSAADAQGDEHEAKVCSGERSE
mmetsp:Transcript_6665/g.20981  ORF Transcript_6665/g.20981 Transcript_6665/m.20981 type:complete len:231 (+) Transcript_6665:72-764(+)